MSHTSTTYYRRLAYTLLVFVAFSLSVQQANAQLVSYESDDGWNLGVTGAIPVFLNASTHTDFNTDGSDQFATRVMSGFNPGNVTFTVTAPEQNGVTVSGVYQINHHLQGASIQNDGLFEGRVADIIVAGNFGTFNVGKGFGVFNSSSIGDNGSQLGVGRFAGPDAADATLGRIGAGYTYANFNPRIIYTTPDLGGLALKVGLINPEKPSGSAVASRSAEIETTAPRVEAQANYLLGFEGGNVDLWAGGLYQTVDVISENFDYGMTGWDVGARLSVANVQLAGSYSQTEGIGADGLIGLSLEGNALAQANVDATQWYAEGLYDFGGVVFGASYGEGSQDATTTVLGSAPDITNELLMVFSRITVTDNLLLLLEFQDFATDAPSFTDYNAFIIGAQLTF